MGKGFAGVMKRHNFKGQKASHGVHKVHRAGGSIGNASYPGHVFKGQKMAGRMGNEKKTIQSVTVVGIDEEKNYLLDYYQHVIHQRFLVSTNHEPSFRH